MASRDRGRVRVEQAAKRVRVILAGEMVADSRRVKLVWEKPYYPTYYLPHQDVRTDLLVATGATDHSPSRGDAEVHTVKVGDREATAGALWYRQSPIGELEGTIRLQWGAMDAWFEEDEEVFVHPRDPYTRVDILQSSRHVRVTVGGVTVADSHQPRILFETACRRATTCPRPTSGWTCSPLPSTARPAPTRARQATTRCT
jgi:uncharacterized protein (DUF427 family)